MDVHTIILVTTLSLSSLSCGICLGVLMENRRSRLANNYRYFIEMQFNELWCSLEDQKDQSHQERLRLRQEINYIQKYVAAGDAVDEFIITSPGTAVNTMILPQAEKGEGIQKDMNHEDVDETVH